MPLVSCKECGHQVASSAATCPSCGVNRRVAAPAVTEVVVRSRSGSTLALGITAVAFGGFSLCGSWIPFLGLLTVPIAFIGVLIGGLGVLLALFRGFRTAGVPLVGTGMCIASIYLAGAVTVKTGETLQDVGKKIEQARVDAKRQEADRQKAKKREADEYIANHVDLYDFEASYFDSLLDGRVPGVTFKVKNRGERTLERVQVVVHFADAKGNVIAEEAFVPIRPYSLESNSRPLKPGYVWQVEKGTKYVAKNVPSEWLERHAKATITEVDFAANETAAPPR
jgi:hypothetical protein